MNKNLRATTRLVAGVAALPAIVGAAALQGLIVGPVLRNNTVIPKLIFTSLRKILGYKVEFNAASAPLVKDKPVWYLANHTSITDVVVAGVGLKGNFVGKSNIAKWPIVGQLAGALKFMGVRREPQYNGESMGKIAKNFNKGHNTIMFPEATVGNGKEVHLFRAGLLELLYGGKATEKKKFRKEKAVPLKQDVVVQPVAIRVKSVNGVNDNAVDLYRMGGSESGLKKFWKRLQLKETTLELTAFPALQKKDYADAKAMANKAAADVATIINPGQTEFTKAPMPVSKRALKKAAKKKQP